MDAIDVVRVSVRDGTTVFSCRVCGEQCPAPQGVPIVQATRDFLDMHPVCADPALHHDGCPTP